MMDGGENVDVGISSAPCVSGGAAGALGEHEVSADKGNKKKSDDEEEAGRDEDQDEDEDEDGGGGAAAGFVPGPLIPLKEQLEKDKDDESLRRWKEKLLGCIDDINGQVEPEVVFHSLGIVTEGSGETIIPLPLNEKQSNILFTLKEGSHYHLKLTFNVQHNIVSGLSYSNTVWRGGFRVDRSKGMLGTFAPQRDPYVFVLEEETTPSLRGVYSAKLKNIDAKAPRCIKFSHLVVFCSDCSLKTMTGDATWNLTIALKSRNIDLLLVRRPEQCNGGDSCP